MAVDAGWCCDGVRDGRSSFQTETRSPFATTNKERDESRAIKITNTGMAWNLESMR